VADSAERCSATAQADLVRAGNHVLHIYLERISYPVGHAALQQ